MACTYGVPWKKTSKAYLVSHQKKGQWVLKMLLWKETFEASERGEILNTLMTT